MTASRLLWAVAVALFALVITWSVAVYPTLPAVVPTGLDANGAPRGTTPKSLLAWLTAPLLMGSVMAALGGLGAVVHRYPGFVSGGAGVDDWRALPLASRQRTAAPIRALMAFVGAFTMALAGVIQYAMYQAALGQRAGWVLPATLIMGVLPIPVGLGIIMRNFEDDVKAEGKRIDAGR